MRTNARISFLNVNRTWILVADRAAAKIFRMESQTKKIELIQELEHPIGLLKDKDLMSDKPGRSKDRKGRGKHSYSSEVTPSKQILVNFAHVIAQILDKARMMDRMDEIILICPPALLGLIRSHLSSPTQKILKASIKKDFAKLTNSELQAAVTKLVKSI